MLFRSKTFSLITGIGLLLLTAMVQADTPFIQGGKPLGSIVTTAQPSRAEQFAAEEVQIFLERITGAKVPVVNGDIPDGKPAIVIGKRPETEKVFQQLQKRHKDREAFAVVPEKEHLILVGNGESATLYAAWDWLETLGVRFILPTQKGVYVPKKNSVSFPKDRKYDAPDLSYRGPAYSMNPKLHAPDSNVLEHGIASSRLFSFRWRMNLNNVFDIADGWYNIGSGHTYSEFLPPSKYAVAHPEWYSMVNGKRTFSGPWQVCFTNPDSPKEFAKNMIAVAEGELKKGVKLERLRFCVSPNDYTGGCTCPECAKLYDRNGSITSLVVLYANRVAEEIHKTYPEARITFYAYDNYSLPPEKVKPGKNVCPEITFWTTSSSFAANHAKPMFSAANAKFRDAVRDWAEMSDAYSLYAYYGHYLWFTPFPQITQMAADFPVIARDHKCYGFYSEDHQNWATQGPNFYLAAKLRWNPGADSDRIMEEYYEAGFGPAAEDIRAYFQTLQRQMDGIPYVNGVVNEIPTLLSPNVIAECNRHIERAAAKMHDMDDAMQWRTNLIVTGWRMSAKVGEMLRAYVAPTDPFRDRKYITSNIREILDFADSPLGRTAFDNSIVTQALGGSLRTAALPLDSLPAGNFRFLDSLPRGGVTKFWTKPVGMAAEQYGYLVPAGGQGYVELPIKAAPGHRIKSLKVSMGWSANKNQLRASVHVIGSDGSQTPVMTEVKAGEISVPDSALGQEVRVRVDCENLTGKPLYALNWWLLVINVE